MIKETRFLINIVKKASELITDEFEVKAKDEFGDLVTNFDYEIEQFLIGNLKKEYPDYDIVSEEYNKDAIITNNCFTIDPIDGTINFAHGLPHFGIQVACIRNYDTISSVIYFPKLNELYYADESGAYLNDKKIHVNNKPYDKGIYVIEGPGNPLLKSSMLEVNKNTRDYKCSALNYAWVARGLLSATSFTKDTPWDFIPGQYLVKQAGGFIYNEERNHIAANTQEFLNIIKDKNNEFISNSLVEKFENGEIDPLEYVKNNTNILSVHNSGIKDIRADWNDNIYILFDDGILYVNENKYDNIKYLYQMDYIEIFAITNDNSIMALCNKEYDNYFKDIKYEKILTYSLGIVALANKEIKTINTFIPSTLIDPYLFMNVEDIKIENDSIYIKKNNQWISLFNN